MHSQNATLYQKIRESKVMQEAEQREARAARADAKRDAALDVAGVAARAR